MVEMKKENEQKKQLESNRRNCDAFPSRAFEESYGDRDDRASWFRGHHPPRDHAVFRGHLIMDVFCNLTRIQPVNQYFASWDTCLSN